ncbi:Protein of unknown function, partial [Gryllus bimaculatus]
MYDLHAQHTRIQQADELRAARDHRTNATKSSAPAQFPLRSAETALGHRKPTQEPQLAASLAAGLPVTLLFQPSIPDCRATTRSCLPLKASETLASEEGRKFGRIRTSVGHSQWGEVASITKLFRRGSRARYRSAAAGRKMAAGDGGDGDGVDKVEAQRRAALAGESS